MDIKVPGYIITKDGEMILIPEGKSHEEIAYRYLQSYYGIEIWNQKKEKINSFVRGLCEVGALLYIGIRKLREENTSPSLILYAPLEELPLVQQKIVFHLYDRSVQEGMKLSFVYDNFEQLNIVGVKDVKKAFFIFLSEAKTGMIHTKTGVIPLNIAPQDVDNKQKLVIANMDSFITKLHYYITLMDYQKNMDLLFYLKEQYTNLFMNAQVEDYQNLEQLIDRSIAFLKDDDQERFYKPQKLMLTEKEVMITKVRQSASSMTPYRFEILDDSSEIGQIEYGIMKKEEHKIFYIYNISSSNLSLVEQVLALLLEEAHVDVVRIITSLPGREHIKKEDDVSSIPLKKREALGLATPQVSYSERLRAEYDVGMYQNPSYIEFPVDVYLSLLQKEEKNKISTHY